LVGALTKKPANGKEDRRSLGQYLEALAAPTRRVHGLAMQGWYWNDTGLMTLHNDYMSRPFTGNPTGFCFAAQPNSRAGRRRIERMRFTRFFGIGTRPVARYNFLDPAFLTVLECAQYLPARLIHCGNRRAQLRRTDTTSLAPLPIANGFPI
jgi:hypothetical protein